MSGVVERVGRAAARRADRRRQEIVSEAEAMGVAASIEEDRVVIEGRGLLDRWLRDASIRNLGRTGA